MVSAAAPSISPLIPFQTVPKREAVSIIEVEKSLKEIDTQLKGLFDNNIKLFKELHNPTGSSEKAIATWRVKYPRESEIEGLITRIMLLKNKIPHIQHTENSKIIPVAIRLDTIHKKALHLKRELQANSSLLLEGNFWAAKKAFFASSEQMPLIPTDSDLSPAVLFAIRQMNPEASSTSSPMDIDKVTKEKLDRLDTIFAFSPLDSLTLYEKLSRHHANARELAKTLCTLGQQAQKLYQQVVRCYTDPTYTDLSNFRAVGANLSERISTVKAAFSTESGPLTTQSLVYANSLLTILNQISNLPLSSSTEKGQIAEVISSATKYLTLVENSYKPDARVDKLEMLQALCAAFEVLHPLYQHDSKASITQLLADIVACKARKFLVCTEEEQEALDQLILRTPLEESQYPLAQLAVLKRLVQALFLEKNPLDMELTLCLYVLSNDVDTHKNLRDQLHSDPLFSKMIQRFHAVCEGKQLERTLIKEASEIVATPKSISVVEWGKLWQRYFQLKPRSTSRPDAQEKMLLHVEKILKRRKGEKQQFSLLEVTKMIQGLTL